MRSNISEQFGRFLTSINFLSIIPAKIARNQTTKAKDLVGISAYFPATGLVIGTICMSLAIILDRSLASQSTNAVIVLYLAVITGGLHLDALADTADGFFGGNSLQKKLKIMREGKSGPFGITAIILVLLFKYTFINTLTGSPRLIAFLTVPALARWPLPALAWRLRSARQRGLGYTITTGTDRGDLISASFLAVAIIIFISWVLGWVYLLLAPILILLAVAWARINQYYIEGVTGDTLGALVELAEVFLFLAIGILARYA